MKSESKKNARKALQGEKKLWGARLYGAKLAGADLQQVELQGSDLTSADLTSTNLQSANLTSTKLVRTLFDSANLQGANLTSANLDRASFNSAILQGANLASAQIHSTHFVGSDLSGACLHRAYFKDPRRNSSYDDGTSETSFKDANLSGAQLTDIRLDGRTTVKFYGADLRDADLTGAYWVDVREEFLPLYRQSSKIRDSDVFWDALRKRGITKDDFYVNRLLSLDGFFGALVGNTRGPDGHLVSAIAPQPRLREEAFNSETRTSDPEAIVSRPRLREEALNSETRTSNPKLDLKQIRHGEKKLAGAQLHGANLAKLDLQQVELQGGDLSLADLDSSNLTRANLTKTNLIRASFRSANLQGANLSSAQISSTRFIGSNLSGACLQSAHIMRPNYAGWWKNGESITSFKDANLTGALLTDIYLDSEREAEWQGAILRDADLTGAYIRVLREEFIPLVTKERRIFRLSRENFLTDEEEYWKARGLTKDDAYEKRLLSLKAFAGAVLQNTRGPDGHIVAPIVSRPRLW